jgi:hypothetical protein
MFYAPAARPRTKWTIKEMTATISRRWTSPPAAWNVNQPRTHATAKTTLPRA